MAMNLKAHVRNLVKDTAIWGAVQKARDRRSIASWEKAGKPAPPPHLIKRHILSVYAASAGLSTLVETGTYFGDMVFAMKDRFQSIYSIELSDDLARMAKRRFRSCSHVQIVAGDSGEIVPQLLDKFSMPCLFWLDGHYSGGITAKGQGDTPVFKELSAILRHPIKTHVILIDDARCFDGTDDYPTLTELEELISSIGPEYKYMVADDVIRIQPRSMPWPDTASQVSDRVTREE